MEILPKRAWAPPMTKGHRTPIQPPPCPLIGEHCPTGRSRKRFLAPGAQARAVTAGQATDLLRQQTDTSSQNNRTG
jgi:hypothetical protein